MDHHRAVRVGPRLRVRRRAQGRASVCRVVPSGIAAILQHRDRDRPTRGSVHLRAGARASSSRPHGRANGDHRVIGDHRQYRLAMDDAAQRGAVANPVATTHALSRDDVDALGGRSVARRRRRQTSRQVDRAQMAEARPAG